MTVASEVIVPIEINLRPSECVHEDEYTTECKFDLHGKYNYELIGLRTFYKYLCVSEIIIVPSRPQSYYYIGKRKIENNTCFFPIYPIAFSVSYAHHLQNQNVFIFIEDFSLPTNIKRREDVQLVLRLKNQLIVKDKIPLHCNMLISKDEFTYSANIGKYQVDINLNPKQVIGLKVNKKDMPKVLQTFKHKDQRLSREGLQVLNLNKNKSIIGHSTIFTEDLRYHIKDQCYFRPVVDSLFVYDEKETIRINVIEPIDLELLYV